MIRLRDLSRILLLLAVLNMRVMCKRIKPSARHSCPSVTRHHKTCTLLRLPRLLAVSGKVAHVTTPVTHHAFTRQRMKCAPSWSHLRGHQPLIAGS